MLDSHTYDSSKESHFPDIVRKNNTKEQDTQPNLSFIAIMIAWEKKLLTTQTPFFNVRVDSGH